MIQDFPPNFRLRSKADFKALKGGRRLTAGGLSLVYCRNHLCHGRIGMAVSRKYGNAVQRNRLKRGIRETFRRHAIRNLSFDILVYPNADSSSGIQPNQIVSSLEHGLLKIAKRESMNT